SPRTRKDYTSIYRSMEVQSFSGERMFGDVMLIDVTKQLAYDIYEHYVVHHGLDSANKAMSAWQAAFKYCALKVPEITSNPFSNLGKETPAPRRQRWTDEQLEAFIKMADEMGFPSIGRCELKYMEQIKRLGDIISLRWSDYHLHEDAWCFPQN